MANNHTHVHTYRDLDKGLQFSSVLRDKSRASLEVALQKPQGEAVFSGCEVVPLPPTFVSLKGPDETSFFPPMCGKLTKIIIFSGRLSPPVPSPCSAENRSPKRACCTGAAPCGRDQGGRNQRLQLQEEAERCVRPKSQR